MVKSDRVQQIGEAIKRIQDQIATAAVRAGRDPSEITLVAVSKNQEIEAILAAYEFGLRDFGENRVQEALTKVSAVPADVNWHFLGQLQRNKARKAAEFAALIHSLDRPALAETLNRIGAEQGRQIAVLVEVNIGEEPSKGGVYPDQAVDLVEQLAGYAHLAIKGLMTVAPLVAQPDQARPFFARMRELAVKIAELKLPNVAMEILSMGMTGDFTAAIAEGSTLVRIGEGIFGPRRQ